MDDPREMRRQNEALLRRSLLMRARAQELLGLVHSSRHLLSCTPGTGTTSSVMKRHPGPCLTCEQDCPEYTLSEALRILLVDEDSAGSVVLGRDLRRLYPNVELVRATTDTEGIRLLGSAEPFHIVIMELRQPDAARLEGVETLLAHTPTTPVVVITGGNKDLAEEVLSLGAQDWLRKRDAHGRVLKRVLDHARHRGRVMALMRQQVMTDSLTGAHNRTGLLAELERALSHDLAPVTLLLMDLDRFKAVNDTFGHPVGDQVLCDVTARMRELVGNGCLARLGGDEFAVVLRGWSAEAVEQLCKALRTAIDEPFVYGDVVAEIGVSIGVAFGEPGEVTSAVMTRADEAMYAAKHRRTAAVLPVVDTVPLYDIDSQMCGIGVSAAVPGRWSVSIAAHWLDLAAEKAELTGQRVFLFVPGEALPELAAALGDRGIPAGQVCLMVAGVGALDTSAELSRVLRAAGVGVGIAGMGGVQCGISALLHLRPDVVTIDEALTVAADSLGKAVLSSLLSACKAVGARVLHVREPISESCERAA